MLEISYQIDKIQPRDFGAMVSEALDRLGEKQGYAPLRLVFFGDPADNAEYLQHRAEIVRQTDERYGEKAPLVSYVAQKPLDAGLVLESQLLPASVAEEGTLCRRSYGRVRYAVVEEREAEQTGGKWLFTEGILPDSLESSILRQSSEVLEILGEILAVEKMEIHSIVRQWNYIEQITAMSDKDNQHYQNFNDARSHFYAMDQWKNGYPAATGIGTRLGGIMVEADALKPSKWGGEGIVALDNELQVAAHDYSQEVLIGTADKKFRQKTTPKFERAKTIVDKRASDPEGCEAQVYISGTAAIRGEDSLTGVGIEKQTVITLENIEFLASRENLQKHGVKVGKEPIIKNFRVYLKTGDLLDAAKKVVEQRCPGIPALYVLTDVCRDELLVEIEGVAQTW